MIDYDLKIKVGKQEFTHSFFLPLLLNHVRKFVLTLSVMYLLGQETSVSSSAKPEPELGSYTCKATTLDDTA